MPKLRAISETGPGGSPDGRFAKFLIAAFVIWNILTMLVILFVIAKTDNHILRAVLCMNTGVSVFWFALGGSLMYAFRNRIRNRVLSLQWNWRVKFVLFSTLLALIEEAITTTMTNCAPLFGVPIGQAYITASTNYLDVVCLHSVVAFVPMFIAWSWLLSEWRFSASSVLLLFGTSGILGECIFGGMQPRFLYGFWIFVYGLMVWLPAYCIPSLRSARRPSILAYVGAPFLPLVCSMPVAFAIMHIHPISCHFPPMRLSSTPAKMAEGPPYGVFHSPTRVVIRGYFEDAMEPFITKDGKYLLFNNLNDPSVNTNLQYAQRVDNVTFDYRGEVSGVNTPALEGVPSVDRNGRIYFVSTRSYSSTFSTLYRGQFNDGTVSNVEIVPGVSLQKPGIVNFDAEISGDGKELYLVDGDFSSDPKPSKADIVIAVGDSNTFHRIANSADILRNVNSGGINYAPCISEDGLELFFTHVDRIAPNAIPAIYRATRASLFSPFARPSKVVGAEGFVELPTLQADGKALYYHKRENGRFVIYRLTR